MLRDAGPDESEQMLLDFVAAEVAVVLETPPRCPSSYEAGLFELGMEPSLMSVELKRRLERGLGAVAATLTFNYPNIRALAGFLLKLVASRRGDLGPATTEGPGRRATGRSRAGLDALSDEELRHNSWCARRDEMNAHAPQTCCLL